MRSVGWKDLGGSFFQELGGDIFQMVCVKSVGWKDLGRNVFHEFGSNLPMGLRDKLWVGRLGWECVRRIV